MKIAYITVSMPFGPSETFFIPEANEIIRLGHELAMIPRWPVGSIVNDDAHELVKYAVRQPLYSIRIFWDAMLETIQRPVDSVRALQLILRGGGILKLLMNLSVFPKALWLSRLVRRSHIDHIHAHWALRTATMAMIASRVSGVPWSFTAHRGDIAENNLLALKVRNACFVRFISENGSRMATSLGADDETHRVVIHMGVEIPTAELCPWVPCERPTVICPANLLPVKGHAYLLDAMQLLKASGVALRLEIAGKGPLENQLRRRILEMDLADCVELVGQVPHHALLDRYARGEIAAVVLPSVDLGNNLHEGIPVCLIEAMAYGVPAVSTATGGVPELLSDGGGLIVPDKDPQALADALRIAVFDPKKRSKLINKGREMVENEYDVKVTTNLLMEQIANATEC